MRLKDLNILTEPAHSVKIYVAGDIEDAKRTCRKFCFEKGLCVTVTATEYIYTGGQEAGVIVGLVNYPRFPKLPTAIDVIAQYLAEQLMEDLCQNSALLDGPAKTVWLTRRPA